MLVLKYKDNPTKLRIEIKEVNEFYLKSEDNITHSCDFCTNNIHRASYAKHLRSKKHLKSDIIIPECLFQNLIGNRPETIYSLKPL